MPATLPGEPDPDHEMIGPAQRRRSLRSSRNGHDLSWNDCFLIFPQLGGLLLRYRVRCPLTGGESHLVYDVAKLRQ
jgi:hypothetical protein